MDFATAAQESINRRGVRRGTAEEYRRLRALACTTLGQADVRAITREQVLEALSGARGTGLGEKSIKNLLGFIRGVLAEVGNSAAAGIRVRAPEPDVHVLTFEQERRLREYLEAQGAPECDALLVLLGTGMRRGELLALIAADWREGEKQLHVARSVDGPTKSGRVRYVDVPDWLVQLLSRAARMAGQGPLFPVHPRALGRTLTRACGNLGIPHVRIHDLRHSRITHLLLTGAPPLYACMQAGHHSPAFTLSVYGHVAVATPEQRRDWANR